MNLTRFESRTARFALKLCMGLALAGLIGRCPKLGAAESNVPIRPAAWRLIGPAPARSGGDRGASPSTPLHRQLRALKARTAGRRSFRPATGSVASPPWRWIRTTEHRLPRHRSDDGRRSDLEQHERGSRVVPPSTRRPEHRLRRGQRVPDEDDRRRRHLDRHGWHGHPRSSTSPSSGIRIGVCRSRG